MLAEAADQAHLIEALHGVLVRLGGTTRVWRTDRLATVIVPGRRDIQPTFAPVAKHYGAVVEAGPPRRGNRKGSVESSVRYVCGPLVADDDRDHRGYHAIQAIPGVGPTFVAVFTVEMGDIGRFRRPAQLCSWPELTPRHHESDDT